MSSQCQGGRRSSARESLQREGERKADGAAWAARSRKHAAAPQRSSGGDPDEAQVTVISSILCFFLCLLCCFIFAYGPLFSSCPTFNILWLPILGYSLQWISTMWSVHTPNALYLPITMSVFLGVASTHTISQKNPFIIVLFICFSNSPDICASTWWESSKLGNFQWDVANSAGYTATVPCAFAIWSCGEARAGTFITLTWPALPRSHWTLLFLTYPTHSRHVVQSPRPISASAIEGCIPALEPNCGH